MDWAAYLARLGCPAPAAPSPEALQALHRAHLLAVPFENLDIHLGRPIALAEDALFDKIVRRRRGGFCYELNGIFAALLGALGFRVTLLSAEVARDEGGFGPPFDHLALRVDLDEPWLADVGFGEGFQAPLRLACTVDQRQDTGLYRLTPDGPYRVLLRDAQPQYRFNLEPHALPEYAAMCRYHQTSPASSFTLQRICTLATPDGRVTLSGMRFIETTRGRRRERGVVNEGEFRTLLRDRFGIDSL